LKLSRLCDLRPCRASAPPAARGTHRHVEQALVAVLDHELAPGERPPRLLLSEERLHARKSHVGQSSANLQNSIYAFTSVAKAHASMSCSAGRSVRGSAWATKMRRRGSALIAAREVASASLARACIRTSGGVRAFS
jgi:hypothetical protein